MPIITEAELLKEVDKLIAESGVRIGFSDIQLKCLQRARNCEEPVPWKVLSEWWETKEWGKMSDTALKNKYHVYLRKNE